MDEDEQLKRAIRASMNNVDEDVQELIDEDREYDNHHRNGHNGFHQSNGYG